MNLFFFSPYSYTQPLPQCLRYSEIYQPYASLGPSVREISYLSEFRIILPVCSVSLPLLPLLLGNNEAFPFILISRPLSLTKLIVSPSRSYIFLPDCPSYLFSNPLYPALTPSLFADHDTLPIATSFSGILPESLCFKVSFCISLRALTHIFHTLFSFPFLVLSGKA